MQCPLDECRRPKTERPPSGGPSKLNSYLRHAASAAAFFFLRQPKKPSRPTPVENSGSAAGSGVVVSENVYASDASEDHSVVPQPFTPAMSLLLPQTNC